MSIRNLKVIMVVVVLLCMGVVIQVGKAEGQTQAIPSFDEHIKRFQEFDKASQLLLSATSPLSVPNTKPKAQYHAELDKAIVAYREFIQKYPSDNLFTPQAMYAIGAALSEQEKPLEAINQFKEIIQKFPTTYTALNAQVQVGKIELKRRNFAQAIAAFESALQKNPNADEVRKAVEVRARPAILYLIFRTYIIQGDLAKATETMAKLHAEFPNESVTIMAMKEIFGVK